VLITRSSSAKSNKDPTPQSFSKIWEKIWLHCHGSNDHQRPTKAASRGYEGPPISFRVQCGGPKMFRGTRGLGLYLGCLGFKCCHGKMTHNQPNSDFFVQRFYEMTKKCLWGIATGWWLNDSSKARHISIYSSNWILWAALTWSLRSLSVPLLTLSMVNQTCLKHVPPFWEHFQS
jgi:hypothetical protein